MTRSKAEARRFQHEGGGEPAEGSGSHEVTGAGLSPVKLGLNKLRLVHKDLPRLEAASVERGRNKQETRDPCIRTDTKQSEAPAGYHHPFPLPGSDLVGLGATAKALRPS